MADNTTLNSGTGGDVIASDDIAGVKFQRVKPAIGADGVATDAVPVSAGMDVTGAAVQAVGLVAQFDDTATAAVTENQFAPVRISTRRALLVEGVANGTAVPTLGSTITPSADVTMQSAAVAVGNGTLLTATGYGTASLQITGTFVGTVTFEGTNDGTNFVAILATQGSASAIGTTATAPGIFRLSVAGLTSIRARISAYTSGSITVVGRATNAPFGAKVVTLPASQTIAGVTTLTGTTSLTPGTAAANLGKAEDAVHATGDVGVMALGVRRDTAAASSGTTGDYEPLSTDALGKLWTADNQVEDLAHTSGDRGSFVLAVRSDTLAATSGTTGDYEAFKTDSVGALWTRDSAAQVDDAAFTPATGRVMPVAFLADEVATDSVDEGDAGIARMTLDRKQIVTLQPHTAGGLTTFMASGSDGSSILVATAQAIKASAGQLYGYYAYNPEASVTFVHFYNVAAASVVVGTTAPLFTIQVPAGSAANLMFPHGVAFANAGWSCAATTTAGGNTAPATGVSLVAWYL